MRDADTRPNAFDKEALQAIRRGESIHFHEDRNELRMMGPLWAAQRRTECHPVGEGDLLGVFSYRFVRAPLLPEPKSRPPIY